MQGATIALIILIIIIIIVIIASSNSTCQNAVSSVLKRNKTKNSEPSNIVEGPRKRNSEPTAVIPSKPALEAVPEIKDIKSSAQLQAEALVKIQEDEQKQKLNTQAQFQLKAQQEALAKVNQIKQQQVEAERKRAPEPNGPQLAPGLVAESKTIDIKTEAEKRAEILRQHQARIAQTQQVQQVEAERKRAPEPNGPQLSPALVPDNTHSQIKTEAEKRAEALRQHQAKQMQLQQLQSQQQQALQVEAERKRGNPLEKVVNQPQHLAAQPNDSSVASQAEKKAETIRKMEIEKEKQRKLQAEKVAKANAEKVQQQQQQKQEVQPKKLESRENDYVPIISGDIDDLFNVKLDVESEFGMTDSQINQLAKEYYDRNLAQKKSSRVRHRSVKQVDTDAAESRLRDSYMRSVSTSNQRINSEEFAADIMRNSILEQSKSQSTKRDYLQKKNIIIH